MATLNTCVENLIKQVSNWEGWRVAEVKRGWMVFPKDRRFPPITIHKTLSDRRAILNAVGRLRRAGAPI